MPQLHAYACYSGRVINLAKTGKERLTCEAAAGGKWRETTGRCSRRTTLLAVSGGDRFAG